MKNARMIFTCGFLLLSAPRSLGQHYLISWAQAKRKENCCKTEVYNYLGVFPDRGKDTTYVYQISCNRAPEVLNTWKFAAHTSNAGDRVDFYFFENDLLSDSLTVLFQNKTIQVGNDAYEVNNAYYDSLKRELSSKHSLTALAGLTIEGLGDYSELIAPLQQKWINKSLCHSCRIEKIMINNKNFQTDTGTHRWTAVYRYNKQGTLEQISGEFYTKILVAGSSRGVHYNIKYNQDRYSLIADEYNIASGTDSKSEEYYQYPISRTSRYIKYKLLVRTKETSVLPATIQALIQAIGFSCKSSSGSKAIKGQTE